MVAIGVVFIFGAFALSNAQTTQTVSTDVMQKHIQRLIQELPTNSPLRGQLINTDRYHRSLNILLSQAIHPGVMYATSVCAIDFNHRGKPKRMSIRQIQYFSEYEGGKAISDDVRMASIRATGIEKVLGDLALQKAQRGFWVDVPRPRPRPFIGVAKIDFFDDEWLPTLNAPLY